MKKISILCLNCFGIPTSFNRKIRFENIAKESLKISPDIMVFQEVWLEREAHILISSLVPAGYKVFPETFKSYNSGGLITFIKNITVETYKFNKFSYPGPFTFVTAPEWIAGKGLQIFTLDHNGIKISMVNTQLLCDYNRTKKIMASIKNQLKEINKTLVNSDFPLILAGDINLEPNDLLLKDFVDKLSLKEDLSADDITVDIRNLNRGIISNMFKRKSFRVDYIFTNNKFNNIKSEIIFKDTLNLDGNTFNLSDHFGIIKTLQLK